LRGDSLTIRVGGPVNAKSTTVRGLDELTLTLLGSKTRKELPSKILERLRGGSQSKEVWPKPHRRDISFLHKIYHQRILRVVVKLELVFLQPRNQLEKQKESEAGFYVEVLGIIVIEGLYRFGHALNLGRDDVHEINSLLNYLKLNYSK